MEGYWDAKTIQEEKRARSQEGLGVESLKLIQQPRSKEERVRSQVIRSQALCLLSILGARAAGENKKSGTEDCGYKEKTPSSLQTCTQKYKGLCRRSCRKLASRQACLEAEILLGGDFECDLNFL